MFYLLSDNTTFNVHRLFRASMWECQKEWGHRISNPMPRYLHPIQTDDHGGECMYLLSASRFHRLLSFVFRKRISKRLERPFKILNLVSWQSMLSTINKNRSFLLIRNTQSNCGFESNVGDTSEEEVSVFWMTLQVNGIAVWIVFEQYGLTWSPLHVPTSWLYRYFLV